VLNNHENLQSTYTGKKANAQPKGAREAGNPKKRKEKKPQEAK
jgi:hypothetical protein